AANVYGVNVPGRDGRAGMATIAAQPAFNLALFREHLSQRLPEYARPVFLRLRSDIETTTTVKIKKIDLPKQVFDPSTISIPLYANDPTAMAFVRLDTPLYERIVGKQVRL